MDKKSIKMNKKYELYEYGEMILLSNSYQKMIETIKTKTNIAKIEEIPSIYNLNDGRFLIIYRGGKFNQNIVKISQFGILDLEQNNK